MKLFAWPSSPYVRKVLLVAYEVGLADRIDRVYARSEHDVKMLHRLNPIGKIPTLVVNDDLVIIESNAICRYLAEHPSRSGDLELPDLEQWALDRNQAVVDGILDAAASGMAERRRPAAVQYRPFMEHLLARIDRCLGELETVLPHYGSKVTLFTISLGATLAYLDFRYSDHHWRPAHADLDTWFADFSERPSMKKTVYRVKDGW